VTTQRDILLVIEVAETSLTYDRGRKARLYAEAEIGEYWVADTEGEAIEVSREPSGSGYRESIRLTGFATVCPLAFPDVVVRLPDVFGGSAPEA
jgi:Uma2 family endonuclease